MRYELDPTAPPAEEVRRVVVEGIDDVCARLRSDEGTFGQAIHESRKRLKEARAVLRLARRGMRKGQAKAAQDTLRDAGRRLAPVRDAEVVLATLDRLRGEDDLAAAFRDELLEELASARGRVSRPEVTGAVLADLDAVREAAGSWRLDVDAGVLTDGLARTHRAGRKALAATLAAPGDDEALHAWRKRVKDGWYHLLLLRAAWRPAVAALADEAHVISEALGSDHDLAVLETRFAGRRSAGGDEEAAELARRLEVARDPLRERALAVGRRLYATPAVNHARLLAGWWRVTVDEVGPRA
ncbi:MAG: CHAD domain-containing protein [Actinomycetota bacterium]